ncbi:MAG: hypothetical protein QME77_11275 [bacterium]|nr:hypothetical protein [bacterium]
MIKVMAIVALMAVAQILPSCGGQSSPAGGSGVSSQAEIIGWVDEKRSRIWEQTPYMVVINAQEYGVPYEFWMAVGVGDLVKFQGGKWTIVRKART